MRTGLSTCMRLWLISMNQVQITPLRSPVETRWKWKDRINNVTSVIRTTSKSKIKIADVMNSTITAKLILMPRHHYLTSCLSSTSFATTPNPPKSQSSPKTRSLTSSWRRQDCSWSRRVADLCVMSSCSDRYCILSTRKQSLHRKNSNKPKNQHKFVSLKRHFDNWALVRAAIKKANPIILL